MKKTLALVIALIMVFGCMLSIAPMAEATDTPAADAPAAKYVPEIAYSNVNYAEGLTLMFAVPAPAAGALEDGASVKVVVWDTASSLYSYNESVATDAVAATAISLEADATKATIGGKEYLVFKYNALSAEMMTDVIYARAAVVNKDNKAISYGEVVDYSVVEYVQTAKGGFAGTSALGSNVVELLDSLLTFGSLSQVYLGGGDEPYTPNGFFANDELKKIWITPVVAGQTFDKVFGGFFKYVEGGYATVYAPFYDNLQISAYKNAAGEVIEDANSSASSAATGFQVPAVNADIELTVEYKVTPVRGITADNFGPGFAADNTSVNSLQGDPDVIEKYKVSFVPKNGEPQITNFVFGDGRTNFSGPSCDPDKDSAKRGNYYHGIKTVANPKNANDLVFLITSTGSPTLQFTNTKANKDFFGFGYGDTVEDALTLEFEIGKPNPDAKVTTGAFYFRTREANYNQDAWAYAGYTAKGNEDHYIFRITEDVVHFQLASSVRGADIVTLPADGSMIKVAITVFSSGAMKAYVSDANGNMQFVAEDVMGENARYTKLKDGYNKAVAEGQTDIAKALEPYANFGNWFAMNVLEPTWVTGPNANGVIKSKVYTDHADFIKTGTVMIDGVETPLIGPGGTLADINKEAVKIYAEANFSFYLDNMMFYGGATYE